MRILTFCRTQILTFFKLLGIEQFFVFVSVFPKRRGSSPNRLKPTLNPLFMQWVTGHGGIPNDASGHPTVHAPSLHVSLQVCQLVSI